MDADLDVIPSEDAFHKRRARLEASIEWLIGVFASQSPGYHDHMLVLDSTPVETARSRETVERAGNARSRSPCWPADCTAARP